MKCIYSFLFLLCSLSIKCGYTATILSESSCTFKEYAAVCGEVEVPQDHLADKSKALILPYKLIKSSLAENVKRPVVIGLTGGPGISNMSFSPRKEVLAVADVLLVGFRGVDGSASLSCPNVDKVITSEKRLFSKQGQKNIKLALNMCFDNFSKQGWDIELFNPQQSIADINATRAALGVDKVILLSGSYGTRLAQYFAMEYAGVVDRIVMVAANPPGRFVWEPNLVTNVMEAYGITDAAKVISTMPETWYGLDLDPARIAISAFAMLYSTDSAPMVIDAFRDAREGDYAGFALLSLAHDQMIEGTMNWGHLTLMAASVDFDFSRNYDQELAATATSFGSPMGRFLWGMMDKAYIKKLPDDFTQLKSIAIPTLIVSGNLDISTPMVLAENELLPHLEQGHIMRVKNAGHYDLWKKAVRSEFSKFIADGALPQDLSLPALATGSSFFTLSLIAKLIVGLVISLLIFLLWLGWKLVQRVAK